MDKTNCTQSIKCTRRLGMAAVYPSEDLYLGTESLMGQGCPPRAAAGRREEIHDRPATRS